MPSVRNFERSSPAFPPSMPPQRTMGFPPPNNPSPFDHRSLFYDQSSPFHSQQQVPLFGDQPPQHGRGYPLTQTSPLAPIAKRPDLESTLSQLAISSPAQPSQTSLREQQIPTPEQKPQPLQAQQRNPKMAELEQKLQQLEAQNAEQAALAKQQEQKLQAATQDSERRQQMLHEQTLAQQKAARDAQEAAKQSSKFKFDLSRPTSKPKHDENRIFMQTHVITDDVRYWLRNDKGKIAQQIQAASGCVSVSSGDIVPGGQTTCNLRGTSAAIAKAIEALSDLQRQVTADPANKPNYDKDRRLARQYQQQQKMQAENAANSKARASHYSPANIQEATGQFYAHQQALMANNASPAGPPAIRETYVPTTSIGGTRTQAGPPQRTTHSGSSSAPDTGEWGEQSRDPNANGNWD